MPIQGITQGAQPIMSYNYGAKNYSRVRKTFSLLLKVMLLVTRLGLCPGRAPSRRAGAHVHSGRGADRNR